MWKYEITTVDKYRVFKFIKLKDMQFIVKQLKLHKKSINKPIVNPRITLLIQYILFKCYNLNNISFITINTSRG